METKNDLLCTMTDRRAAPLISLPLDSESGTGPIDTESQPQL